VAATGDDEDNLVVSLLAKRRYGAPRVVAVVRGERVLPGGGPLEPGDEVLAVTALAVEPALRRAIGGQAGGSHVPGG
jgi:hypothetical protein